METPMIGEVVVVPYPYSNQSGTKRRPALVLSPLMGEDLLMCQITSRSDSDEYVILLQDTDFTQGKLQLDSYIRPNKISTIERGEIIYKIGKLKLEKTKQVLKAIQKVFELD